MERCYLHLRWYFLIQHGCDLFQVCPWQVIVGLIVEPLLGKRWARPMQLKAFWLYGASNASLAVLTDGSMRWLIFKVNTLSSSSLLTNAEYTTGQVTFSSLESMNSCLDWRALKHQISDLADKLETWDNNMGRGAYVMGHDSTDRKAEDKLSKVDIVT